MPAELGTVEPDVPAELGTVTPQGAKSGTIPVRAAACADGLKHPQEQVRVERGAARVQVAAWAKTSQNLSEVVGVEVGQAPIETVDSDPTQVGVMSSWQVGQYGTNPSTASSSRLRPPSNSIVTIVTRSDSVLRPQPQRRCPWRRLSAVTNRIGDAMQEAGRALPLRDPPSCEHRA
jgi:hypothetical protein